jgi:hypothetical protein
MVTIIGHEKRKNSEDQDFNVLILQGDVEPVISGGTGKPYFTARKTSVPCTFDDKTAKKLVGKALQGRIDRIECDVYEYEIPSTGKKIKLTHTYQYSTEPSNIEEVVMG